MGLFTVLLTAYFFITAIPAAVVMMSYAYNDTTELANRLAGRLDLTGSVNARGGRGTSARRHVKGIRGPESADKLVREHGAGHEPWLPA